MRSSETNLVRDVLGPRTCTIPETHVGVLHSVALDWVVAIVPPVALGPLTPLGALASFSRIDERAV
jgi:hypothetical protein